MANVYDVGVHFVDTDDTTISGKVYISAIKYIGNASGTVVIKSGSSSGDTIWQESGASNVFNQVCISAKDGIHIAITNGAKVFIYLKT